MSLVPLVAALCQLYYMPCQLLNWPNLYRLKGDQKIRRIEFFACLLTALMAAVIGVLRDLCTWKYRRTIAPGGLVSSESTAA